MGEGHFSKVQELNMFRYIFVLSLLLFGCGTINNNKKSMSKVEIIKSYPTTNEIILSKGATIPDRTPIISEDIANISENPTHISTSKTNIISATNKNFAIINITKDNIVSYDAKQDDNFSWLLIFFLVLHIVSVLAISRTKWFKKLINY